MSFALSLAPAACPAPAGAGDLLSVTEAAAAARVTTRTLSNYWQAGAGPARTRVGGRVVHISGGASRMAGVRDRRKPPTQPAPSGGSIGTIRRWH
jgi:hypothetical protein